MPPILYPIMYSIFYHQASYNIIILPSTCMYRPGPKLIIIIPLNLPIIQIIILHLSRESYLLYLKKLTNANEREYGQNVHFDQKVI